MANTNLTTSLYRNMNAARFANTVSLSQDIFYLFAGVSTPFFAGIVPQPRDDVSDTVITPFSTMLFGKQVFSNSVSMMINRYDYVQGTQYAMYNDADPLLLTKPYYAVVNAGAYYHVFKVLDNNNGSPSLYQPNFSDIDAGDDNYMTADGYVWKYMYSADVATVNKFATISSFPYVPNNAVIQAATPGSIDVIQVLQGGNGYSNYLKGTFSVSDVRLNGNDFAYSISSNAAPYQHYYTGCIIYITADALGSSAGQFKTILEYNVNATTKWVTLDSPFINVPQNGAQYQIYPGVNIVGDGNQTANATAWAVVNTVTNTISHTQVLSRGSGYQSATASVFAANAVGVGSSATLRPIYSPPGGHGSHPDKELNATDVCVSVTLANTEANTIFSNTIYQSIGLVRNPTFANVETHFSNLTSAAFPGEPFHSLGLMAIRATANIVAGGTTIDAADADFTRQLVVGNLLVVGNGSFYQFNSVNSITNSTHIKLDTALSTTANGVTLYSTSVYASGTVVGVSSANVLFIDDLQGTINIGDYMIGEFSGAFGQVSSVLRSGTAKSFSTFIGAWQYDGSVQGGAFQLNEPIVKNNAQDIANGIMSSLSSNLTRMYLTSQLGVFNANDVVTGNTSGATFKIIDKYQPEVFFGSGDILYVENFSAINRANSRSEVFKLILSF